MHVVMLSVVNIVVGLYYCELNHIKCTHIIHKLDQHVVNFYPCVKKTTPFIGLETRSHVFTLKLEITQLLSNALNDDCTNFHKNCLFEIDV